MKEVITITNNTTDIQTLWARRREIKATMDSLKAEDNAIVNALNEALQLNPQDDSVKHFDIDGLKLKATPKINRKVDSERTLTLLAEDPDAQRFADIFKHKLDLQIGKWKKLSTDEQAIFADCITETPGKTEYEEETV